MIELRSLPWLGDGLSLDRHLGGYTQNLIASHHPHLPSTSHQSLPPGALQTP